MELILFLSVLVNVYQYKESSCIVQKALVEKIGVCDSFGNCSVLLDNGDVEIEKMPIVGQFKTYEKCSF